MNDQQQFTNQGLSYGDPRPFNTDPREQPGALPRGLNTDPREQPQWQPMPPVMARPPQQGGYHPWRWLGISVVILVVIFGGLFTARILLTHQITTTRTFQVGASPRLVLTSDSGNVRISSGATNQITIVAREQIFLGDNSQIPVQYTLSSDGNTLTVNANDQTTFVFFSVSHSGVDFDVTVPNQTALDVHDSSGDITAQGVNGSMRLTTSSGDVTTDGGSGVVSLTSSSGDIKASDITGQMTLTTSSGDVTALNANATGNSTFQTSSGDITFSGTLAPGGSYGFQDSSGDISVTLPGSASFQVQATTSSGDITSDFPNVSVLSGQGSGAIASGRNGSAAAVATVTIHTSSGDIHLRRS